ncbi:MAG TPA: hypothetical protein VMD02_06645 [Candidatus Omnitrophota bacterium]|nr:hypothetical protein [Candidatus Omnitrophota bacterium]
MRIYDYSVLNNIKPGMPALRLAASDRKPPLPCGKSDNIYRGIVDLARVMGLPVIPARTLALLRDDKYFRYCFSLVSDTHLYYPRDPVSRNMINNGDEYYNYEFSGKVRKRLAELIRDPGLCTEQDLFRGLVCHLNNFHANLPGGLYRDPKMMLYCEHKLGYMRQIDLAMLSLGITASQVLGSRAECEEEIGLGESFAKRVEFHKLCLRIFDEVVGRYRVDPYALIR